jgi:hypothetical protein
MAPTCHAHSHPTHAAKPFGPQEEVALPARGQSLEKLLLECLLKRQLKSSSQDLLCSTLCPKLGKFITRSPGQASGSLLLSHLGVTPPPTGIFRRENCQAAAQHGPSRHGLSPAGSGEVFLGPNPDRCLCAVAGCASDGQVDVEAPF